MGSQPLIYSLPPWPPPCSTQAAIVWGGERINALLALHWERFSTQNYFDPKGLFFSAVVSGPLIGLLVVILVRSASEVGISAFFVRLSLLKLLSFRIPVQVNVLVLASSLLIKLKRAEFRKHGVMEYSKCDVDHRTIPWNPTILWNFEMVPTEKWCLSTVVRSLLSRFTPNALFVLDLRKSSVESICH